MSAGELSRAARASALVSAALAVVGVLNAVQRLLGSQLWTVVAFLGASVSLATAVYLAALARRSGRARPEDEVTPS